MKQPSIRIRSIKTRVRNRIFGRGLPWNKVRNKIFGPVYDQIPEIFEKVHQALLEEWPRDKIRDQRSALGNDLWGSAERHL
jgi:hypothetical protein